MGFRSKATYFIRTYGVATAGALTAVGVILYARGGKEKNVHLATKWSENVHEPSGVWNNNWDRREPEHLVKPAKQGEIKNGTTLENEVNSATPTATRHLILIRHGQYNDAVDDFGRTLTKLGQEQADITGRRLKDINLPYTKLMSSTMTRAIETGDIIHKHLPHLAIERDDLLREGAPIRPEPPSSHWRPDASFYKEGARIEAAYRKYFHRADVDQKENSYEVYVFHANVIRYFVCRALQFPPEGWLRISLANGSMTHMVIRPSGRVHIRSLGEHGFMPPDKISFS